MKTALNLRLGVTLVVLSSPAPSQALEPQSAAARALNSAWSDGQAEIAIYESSLMRYGERRPFREVLITVKERFDERRMVKTDQPGKAPRHEFDVMKSHRILHFVTGIYDYHQAVSYFAPFFSSPLEGSPLGSVRESFSFGERPAKLALSSVEWCGTFFSEWLGRDHALTERSFSYFDGEADRTRTLRPPKGEAWLSEDGWPLWARGLAGYAHTTGPLDVLILSSALEARFSHQPVRWIKGSVELKVGPTTDVVVLKVGKLRSWTITIGRSENRPILEYQSSHGAQGKLIKRERMPYWRFNQEKHNRLRHDLGLLDRDDLKPSATGENP